MTKRISCVTIHNASLLRQIRQKAGWSQPELARRAGVHLQTVKYWETERPDTRRDGHACELFAKAFTKAGFPAQVPTYSRRYSAISVTPAQNCVGQNQPANAPVQNLSKLDIQSQCGAKTRSGKPCQMKPQPGKSRCALHGGLSTGPMTEAGRQKIAEAQRARWERHRQAMRMETV